MARCQCGCGGYARKGNKYILGHNKRIAGVHGFTHSSESARVFVPFDCEKEIGSISDKRPYGFSSQEEAFSWWQKNRMAYMKKACKEFLAEVKSHRDKSDIQDYVCLGDRGNIFFELEFGLYPDDEEKILLLESHSLWYPGERNMIIVEGKKIPETKFKGCLLHPCGCPIKWPDVSAIKLEYGEWFKADCQSTKKIQNGR